MDVRNGSEDSSNRLEGGRSYSEDLDRIYTAAQEETFIRKLREL